MTQSNSWEMDGLAINGLAINGLAINGLAINGLAINGLAMDGLAMDGLTMGKARGKARKLSKRGPGNFPCIVTGCVKGELKNEKLHRKI